MAATSTMVQMNTRIDRTLKQEGDRVFKAMGFSPSEAVRGFYRFACSHAMDRATLDPVLSQTEEADELPFSELKSLWTRFVSDAGLSQHAQRTAPSIQEEIDFDKECEFERLMAKNYGEGWRDEL